MMRQKAGAANLFADQLPRAHFLDMQYYSELEGICTACEA